MEKRIDGNWLKTDCVDMFGNTFVVGDMVARGIVYDRSANIQVAKVTRIEDGKIYLSNSKVAIWYPGRLLIITKLFEK